MATDSLPFTLPRDANRHPIQVAQRLQFSDATGTPVQSPKTSVGTGGQAFVVPAGAFTFTFRADAAGYVSSSGAFDSSNGYYQFAANTDFVYPCANMAGSSIYIRSVSGSITVYFMFEMGA